jgi:dihydrofolate reductase
MQIVGIAAVARNGVIGAGNDIPWRIPEDWARFKRLTMGHVLVMGRKTYESIGRPLAGRRTIVVTRQPGWRAEGVGVADTVDAALDVASAFPTGLVFVAGGGEVYRAAWERLERLEITEVWASPTGDVTFPVIDPKTWQQIGREDYEGYSFASYERRASRAT